MTTVIRNALATPERNIPASRPGANCVDVIVTVPAAAAEDSTYSVITLPLRARLHGISRVYHGDLASAESPTMDIGLRPVKGNFTEVEDAINDGIDVEAGAAEIPLLADPGDWGKMIGELTDATNYGGNAELFIAIKDDAANTGGTVAFSLVYSLD